MLNYTYTVTINMIKVTECVHELDESSTARVCKYCGVGLPFDSDWTWINPIDSGINGSDLYQYGINGWDLYA